MIEITDIAGQMPSAIESTLEALLSSSDSELAETGEELSLFYRTAGIAELLLNLNVDEFYHMLMRSALARIYVYKKLTDAAKVNDRFCKSSRAACFYDALAARRTDLAQQIANSAPQQKSIFEYEDDYDYVRFLFELVNEAGEETLKGILEQFQTDLQGDKSPRFLVCKALLEREQEDFDTYFDALLLNWAQYLDDQKESMSRDEVAYAGNQHLFIEGLALLNIADSLGLKTKPGYDYCPKEARRPMKKEFLMDSFPLSPV